MQIIEHIPEMRSWSEAERRQHRRIALVPTMGFLHEAHLKLVREAKDRADRVVVSIFVNPAQFAPEEDFAGYPRDFETDRRLLLTERVDVLFRPPTAEIYPQGYQTYVEVEKLSAPLCGAFRSGHFRGVATVVAKLFHIVRPHAAVFGRKDYQQLQIIRRLVRDLNFDIDIVDYPIVREPNGLAMSSRNAYLTRKERDAALSISRSLGKAEAMVRRGETGGAAIVRAVRNEIGKESIAKIEYVSLCDPETLREVDRVRGAALLAVAVRIGKARLIDNTVLES
ncbi:MAG TPA: pantoate--beta-alanine ligase [Candidatus Binatia bacterium]|nr:pantoate--beta-alanine ligase [Candidatus Binatia bacterium]